MVLQNNQQSSPETSIEPNDSGADIYNKDTYHGNGYIEVSPPILIGQNQECPERYTSSTVEVISAYLLLEQKAKDIENAKTGKNNMVAMYDLQAVLPTPSEDISTFYRAN
ncbi:hypothetical protein ILUMI_21904 [Ignelater luminosus]|uniref:Uncharacterized protein n=1 Tax=Ignelater luminosus TaxID=2038154 RepID=A0A8K0CFD3_IGNLU|nr:hypothetical protein ILUMI_21904 [Ignelater luminosus]